MSGSPDESTIEPSNEPSNEPTEGSSNGSSHWRRSARLFVRDPIAVASLAYLIIVVVMAAAAPVVATHDPNEQDLLQQFAGPSGDHWLGTDNLGRDTFSRLVYGTQVSLQMSLSVSALGVLIAVPVGLLAGYRSGIVDVVVMRLTDALMSVPPLVLALAVAGILGPGTGNAVLALTVVVVPGLVRLVRAQALAVREEGYVDASRAIGTGAPVILLRRIFPHVLSPLLVQVSLLLGTILVVEASLSFLGLGQQLPNASWGAMLRSGFDLIATDPRLIMVPGVAIALTTLAFNALGDGLRDALLGAGLPRRKKGDTLGTTSVMFTPAPATAGTVDGAADAATTDEGATADTDEGATADTDEGATADGVTADAATAGKATAEGAGDNGATAEGATAGKADGGTEGKATGKDGGVAVAGPKDAVTATAPAPDGGDERPAEVVLSVRDLSVGFDSGEDDVVGVLDRVNLEVRRGEILGLVGESGCGKTVTAQTILRLLPSPPARILGGEVLFEGQDLLRLSSRRLRHVRGRDIAMVFQDPMASLNPAFTIGDQIVEAQRVHKKVAKSAARDRAAELLDLVGIPDPRRRLDDFPHTFSGGMRQRALIAMALANQPKLLIADEPTTALDVTVQAQILELIRGLREEFGMSVLFVTHDLGVVQDLCDRVTVMYAGQVVERSAVGDMFSGPLHPYSQALLRSRPKLGAQLDRLPSIPGVVPRPHAMPEGCRFQQRCDHARDDCGTAPVPVAMPAAGRVVRCLHHGDLDGAGPPGDDREAAREVVAQP